MMTSGKRIIPRHVCICAALAITFLVAGLIVLLSVVPVFFLKNAKRKKGPGAAAVD